eukprot:CAMPEP_0180398136 /NCGR_PEP_ID=MMETSP0989-20121125/36454_1 /TAXON_ID=697907 /ORGANISM="non described non described, Strain CCMP2293" /LENGTH=283 /DNA_ID=CAMNT_0022400731 /DNA_START=62 /DNA_END=910 /DNA_ORIENTATION=-
MADFDAFISKIRALHTNLGDDSEEEKNIADQIAQSLKKQWDKPPTKELEVTHRNLVDDQVRQMLFFPGEEDAELYPQLLAIAPDGAPKEHPQRRVLTAALPILYLVHAKQWKFARAFILAGGLRALVPLMAEANLYLRSQAVETFATLTDMNEGIDWLGDQRRRGRAALPAVRPLASNRAHPDACREPEGVVSRGGLLLPAAPRVLPQLDAARYTSDRVLYVSQQVLDAFKNWTADNPDAIQEEESLAKTLFDDFNRWPSAEARREAESAAKPPSAQACSVSS